MTKTGCVHVRLPSIAAVNTMTAYAERVYFILQLWSVMRGSQGRSLKAGTEAEAMEACCILACYSCLAQLAFLYNTGLSAQGCLCPSSSIFNLENAAQACPRAIWRGQFHS